MQRKGQMMGWYGLRMNDRSTRYMKEWKDKRGRLLSRRRKGRSLTGASSFVSAKYESLSKTGELSCTSNTSMTIVVDDDEDGLRRSYAVT